MENVINRNEPHTSYRVKTVPKAVSFLRHPVFRRQSLGHITDGVWNSSPYSGLHQCSSIQSHRGTIVLWEVERHDLWGVKPDVLIWYAQLLQPSLVDKEINSLAWDSVSIAFSSLDPTPNTEWTEDIWNHLSTNLSPFTMSSVLCMTGTVLTDVAQYDMVVRHHRVCWHPHTSSTSTINSCS